MAALASPHLWRPCSASSGTSSGPRSSIGNTRAPVSGPVPASASSGSKASPRSEPPLPSGWECSQCKCLTSMASASCNQCCTAYVVTCRVILPNMHVVQMDEETAATSIAEHAPPHVESSWECKRCRTLNPWVTDKCECGEEFAWGGRVLLPNGRYAHSYYQQLAVPCRGLPS